MTAAGRRRIRRRDFIASVVGGSIVGGSAVGASVAAAAMLAPTRRSRVFCAGEGVTDITPPLGIELGGFHRAPGNERRIRGIRQPASARALVMALGKTRVAIVSLDVCGVGHEMATRTRRQIAQATGIPADHVRICATHTHSAPGFLYLRQWGAISRPYMATVEKQAALAVVRAQADLAPAELSVGKSRARGGNFNRTCKTWKTDAEFGAESTDTERWLDTILHVLLFERAAARQNLLWYHFSAHPVCFADELAGPDFPGMVAEWARAKHAVTPSFLQGHAGDVNPGDGTPWRGDANETTHAVCTALDGALDNASRIKVDALESGRAPLALPLDIELFRNWLDAYRQNPAGCNRGHWVDARFAKAWFEANTDYDLKQTQLNRTISALRLGSVGLLFHPAELYSYYGLAIRRASPLADTLVVGYTDGIVGYLPDPKAYEAGEYAATTVPKILDYPPFQPTAARQMSAALVDLMHDATRPSGPA